MKRMLTSFSLLGMIFFTSGSAAAHQASPQNSAQQKPQTELRTVYQKWLNEDAAYIITIAEKSAFTKLASDEERERFIEQFWRKRDANPATEANEYREEYYGRIAYANQHFASTLSGWQTDRGRTYITYGKPDKVISQAAGDSSASQPLEVWIYHNIPGVGQNVRFAFIDVTGKGDFRLRSAPGK
ncbi:MAG: GWxTD domain-containing protein [Acidobacteriota bacterium]|nr:GWxTD domain-containing protein [Acidobacteriota bacterium]